MTGSWNDFNDAQNTSIMPKGEIVKVRTVIRPGGYDDPAQGWTGGYATRGDSGAVYLNAEFTVLEGPYARRKIFTLIGLHSPKGPEWANMGRALAAHAARHGDRYLRLPRHPHAGPRRHL